MPESITITEEQRREVLDGFVAGESIGRLAERAGLEPEVAASILRAAVHAHRTAEPCETQLRKIWSDLALVHGQMRRTFDETRWAREAIQRQVDRGQHEWAVALLWQVWHGVRSGVGYLRRSQGTPADLEHVLGLLQPIVDRLDRDLPATAGGRGWPASSAGLLLGHCAGTSQPTNRVHDPATGKSGTLTANRGNETDSSGVPGKSHAVRWDDGSTTVHPWPQDFSPPGAGDDK